MKSQKEFNFFFQNKQEQHEWIFLKTYQHLFYEDVRYRGGGIAGEPAPVAKPHSAQRTKDKWKISLKTENSTCPVSRWASHRQSSNKQKEKNKREQLRFLYTYYTHICYLKEEALMAFITLDKWGLNLKTKGKCSGKKEALLVPLVDFLCLLLLPFLLSPSFSKRRTFCGHRGFHALSETDKSFTPKGPKDQTFLFLNRNIWY